MDLVNAIIPNTTCNTSIIMNSVVYTCANIKEESIFKPPLLFALWIIYQVFVSKNVEGKQ